MRCPHSREQRSRRSCRTFNVQRFDSSVKGGMYTTCDFCRRCRKWSRYMGKNSWRWCDGCFHGITVYSHHGGPVSEDYSKPVSITGEDIVFTTKISGSPCTVINTPYVQKIGTQQNAIERILSKNKRLKKYVKMLTYSKGMKSVEKAAFRCDL